jgi:hypothetical protein
MGVFVGHRHGYLTGIGIRVRCWRRDSLVMLIYVSRVGMIWLMPRWSLDHGIGRSGMVMLRSVPLSVHILGSIICWCRMLLLTGRRRRFLMRLIAPGTNNLALFRRCWQSTTSARRIRR